MAIVLSLTDGQAQSLVAVLGKSYEYNHIQAGEYTDMRVVFDKIRSGQRKVPEVNALTRKRIAVLQRNRFTGGIK